MNRDEVKAKAGKAAKYVEEQAQAGLVKAETKWPIGTAITFLMIGFFLGAYLWSLWPRK
jgi:hypothetical protein